MSHADVLASGRRRCDSQLWNHCWQWAAAGTDWVKGHFTKAAKTYSDIDFILIFHVST